MERIIVSSVQKEFATERAAIRDYIHGDPLLRRFFHVFLFEDLPASDRMAETFKNPFLPIRYSKERSLNLWISQRIS